VAYAKARDIGDQVFVGRAVQGLAYC